MNIIKLSILHTRMADDTLPFVMLHEVHSLHTGMSASHYRLFILGADGFVYGDMPNLRSEVRITGVYAIPLEVKRGSDAYEIRCNADAMFMIAYIDEMGKTAHMVMLANRCSLDNSLNLFRFAHALRNAVEANGAIPDAIDGKKYRETLRDLRARQISDDPHAVLAHITAITTAILKACQPITIADLAMLMRVLGLADSAIAECFQVLPVDANALFAATDK